MSVSFEELEGSPSVTINQFGTSAVRVFRVAWDDWQAFARELIGTYRIVGAAPLFVPPIQFPGLPNLIVSDLRVEPFDPSRPDGAAGVTLGAQTNAYPEGGARVTATYRTLFDGDNRPRKDLPEVPDGTVLTYSADLGAEYVSTPGRTWRWENAAGEPLAEDMNPGVLIPTGAFQLVWQRVPLPPWDKIRELRGKVNASEFVGAPPGTALFLGARATREFQFIEEGGFWRLEYSFVENTRTLSDGVTKVGWNYLYRHEAIGGEHWIEVADESGNRLYAEGDFDELFQFE